MHSLGAALLYFWLICLMIGFVMLFVWGLCAWFVAFGREIREQFRCPAGGRWTWRQRIQAGIWACFAMTFVLIFLLPWKR